MAKIKVTLKKGLAGKNNKNREIVRVMGLRKVGDTKEYEKTPAIEGMIKKVAYLLSVEEK
ncbi:MAG: 50S ribosomal protein L30 [Candidatus Aerophobetes bacterium ADurb.Bin490]|jgi:large subunit ribosomal protein L30|nr:MAG: 50S ribosomal protein L30 [Candidatus Aerophobetes bacterium ADurb.Bin490]HNZ29278.1 50S ribosomal protein L30 [Candidatus Goldiibacteriota bacterium]HPI03233.1 50S ribosomal protein L30 [Candidatus Goldiibacteriota bacterium]HRQ42957.1 50S ribosomal protein L30 [Candidatus Goldiibacteriota bacterium]